LYIIYIYIYIYIYIEVDKCFIDFVNRSIAILMSNIKTFKKFRFEGKIVMYDY